MTSIWMWGKVRGGAPKSGLLCSSPSSPPPPSPNKIGKLIYVRAVPEHSFIIILYTRERFGGSYNFLFVDLSNQSRFSLKNSLYFLPKVSSKGESNLSTESGGEERKEQLNFAVFTLLFSLPRLSLSLADSNTSAK